MADEKKARILVIDDDPNLRKSLSDILMAKGYDAVSAKDGTEGLALFRDAFVNVALVDLMLPDLPGLEVLGRIKAGSPSTEVIILTGHAALETAIEATNKGAFSYLQKPYELDHLLMNVRTAVEKQLAEQKIERLASFPRLNPNPIIEIDSGCEITYMNPAAERTFPDISSLGSRHPVIQGVEEMFARFQESEVRQIVREVKAGGSTYEEYLSYVREAGMIRIYTLDITERKLAEEALQRQLDEVERLNKLMVGREVKMEEMRRRLRELEAEHEGTRAKDGGGTR